MFRVFHMFQRYVSSHHLCFPDACCKCVYLDVAYVSHIRCMCFIWIFVYGCNGFQVFSGVFLSLLEACFKCFNYLQKYVATVVFRCFKSRSCVASLLPTVCCIVSPGAGRTSIRCRSRVLPNRRRRASFSSCLSGGTTLAWSAKRSVARERPSKHQGASTFYS